MNNRPLSRRRFGPVAVAAVFTALTLLGVGGVSRYALLTIVVDGLSAIVVLAPPVLGGVALVPLFGIGKMPLRWHLLLGAAMGLGTASLLMLIFGLAGFLNRPLWLGILVVSAAAGLLRLQRLSTEATRDLRATATEHRPVRATFLWLPVCPFIALALLAAANAPGFLWREEGFGYDVLEYHLQLPKEYLAAGRIAYLPHNVYANFPANVEMLYLLAMIVLRDAADIGVTANLIHAAFGGLTVFAAWTIGRDRSRAAGIVAGALAATTGWFVYLSGLAYVDHGVLFFGLAALGAVLRSEPPTQGSAGTSANGTGSSRWRLVAGVLAGFACGCKYTAVPMVAAPLAIAIGVIGKTSPRRRFTRMVLFSAAATIACSPWLLKNLVFTGNPVFPLANTVFRANPPGWGKEETQRWDRGHETPPAERSLGARVRAGWKRIIADPDQRFGPLVLSLGLMGLLWRKRDRADWALLVVLLIQLAVWLFATHLFARFAVVMLVPLVILGGRAMTAAPNRLRSSVIVSAIAVGTAWNLVFAGRMYARESVDAAGASLIHDGLLPGYEYFNTVNRELPGDARILLVGDAKAFYFDLAVDYCVAFNRSPFFEAVLRAETAETLLAWLRERRYTHVLVNWSELRRLASTYGYSPFVEPGRLETAFDEMTGSGLRRVTGFTHPRAAGRYVELFEVPR